MMTRRAALVLLTVLLAAGPLFASGEQETKSAGAGAAGGPVSAYQPAGKVTLAFWHSYSGFRGELFNSLVKEWVQANPNIQIKPEYGGNLWSMRDKLLTAIAGGSGPDLA
jgi:ABC-type glycerol-3-phosphate transport system substrate-binding protein